MKACKIQSIIVFLVLTFLSTAIFSGSKLLYNFNGEVQNYFLGVSVASAGDVNNDGFSDIIIGSPAVNRFVDSSNPFPGRAYVYSGLTGETLYVFTGEANFDHFGTSVSGAGDVNNDGFDDLIVGAPYNDSGDFRSGRAYVYSGQTGSIIYTFTGIGGTSFGSNELIGGSVSSAGDVNNDNYDDVIVGSFRSDNVVVYSGIDGDTLYLLSKGLCCDDFGYSVAGAGDVDNDGFSDFIIGAPAINSNDNQNNHEPGAAFVYSGASGNIIYAFTGEAEDDEFGFSVSSAGDVNNDGYDDLIIGARSNTAGGLLAGRAYVFSGFDGDTLYVLTGDLAGWFGHSVASAGDFNNDGFDDFVVGAPIDVAGGGNGGRVFVFSGKTGDTLLFMSGEVASDAFGHSVASAGDIDADGFSDLIIGAYLNDETAVNAGQAYVFVQCCVGDRGDLNGDGTDANILDLTFLVDFIFRGGVESPCPEAADITADGTPSNILDLTYLVDFIFRGGPPPGPC